MRNISKINGSTLSLESYRGDPISLNESFVYSEQPVYTGPELDLVKADDPKKSLILFVILIVMALLVYYVKL